MWQSVEYAAFWVGPESDKYRLSVFGFTGDTGDALAAPVHVARISKGMQFSCVDQDNDNCFAHCAAESKGGWWLNCCSRSILNTDGAACWNVATDVYVLDVIFSRMLVKLDPLQLID